MFLPQSIIDKAMTDARSVEPLLTPIKAGVRLNGGAKLIDV